MKRRLSFPAAIHAFVIAILLITPLFTFAGEGTMIPHESIITSADQKAVERLGHRGGGLGVISDIRTIQGLSGTTGAAISATKGEALNLEQAIEDLQADVRDNQIFIQLSSDVLFDFDKSEIKPGAKSELGKLALIIKEKAKGPVAIHGHTDSKGTDDYNEALSLRRANAVKRWLVEQGGARVDYTVKGYGESRPVAPNTHPDGTDNPEGRAQNRRVEIVIQAAQLSP
jgi:outer membrane protein OmpA-like peptidoglycan-associated protein